MKEILFLLPFAIAINANCQTKPKVDPSSVGFIVLDSTIFVGTGFVLDTKRQVITCAHFVGDNNKVYFGSGDIKDSKNRLHRLKVVKLYLPNDLAVLETDTDLCTTPLQSVYRYSDNTNHNVYYLGYDLAKPNPSLMVMQTNLAKINSGISMLGGGNFYDFYGPILPGYSGSPVIIDNNKVVGVINERDTGTPGKLTDIAYSIVPVGKN